MQAPCHHQIQMANGLYPSHPEPCGIRREGLVKAMIAISGKYALQINSPTPITSERQHEEYLAVLDKLACKDNPTSEEEKYAEVLMTLIEAYEEEHHAIPEASPLNVLRALMDSTNLRQKALI